MSQIESSTWWGRHSIPLNHTGYWQVGPLHLWIQHLPQQWRIIREQGLDWFDPTVRSMPPSDAISVPSAHPHRPLNEHRFAFHQSSDELIFSPALADRPMVTKLQTPVSILPGEDVTLYVSTPLWVRLEMIQPSRQLTEIPALRPSDTWFGPMSKAGDLCYASRSPAYLRLEDIPVRQHLAITAVMIRNLASDALLLERLNLPLPRLSLFYSPRSGFWTDLVTLERKESAELASLKLERQPPPAAATPQFIAQPRAGLGGEQSMVFRAFSNLLPLSRS